MKVLAIRGENLASLAAPFEIDLTQGPLAGAGLFAITGPTGAGKSTLLDALCLALYDETPRLQGASRYNVGRASDPKDNVGANDARSILRRGAGAGFAQVDFEGTDGRRYRAQWSVRRARERADGRFQSTEVTLADLETGKTIGSTKTEALREIAARTGLAFDQFRRSVLLAQGDFAAFLRAGAADRGELLERMTGKEIYGRISIEAFRRAREERAKLEAIELESGAILVMGPIERAAIEAEVAAASEALTASRGALERALAGVRWHERAAAIERDLAQAEAALVHAQARSTAADATREEVRRTRAAEPLRPLLEAADRARADHERASHERARRDEAARGISAGALAAAARETEAQRTASDATAALDAARPALDAARALDVRIREAEDASRRAAGEAEGAGRGAAQAARRLAELEAQRGAEASRRDGARAWLAANAALRPLALEWPRWRDELDRYGRALSLARSAEDRKAPLEAARLRADQALGRAKAAEQRAFLAHETELAALQLAKAAADLAPTDLLREERVRLEERRASLEGLAKAAAEAAEAAKESTQEHWKAEVALGEAAQALDEAAKAERAAAEAEAARAEAQAALDGLRAALGLDARRAELRDGVPCSLCGATEHPWAHAAPAFRSLAGEQAERARALGERRASEAGRASAARARHAAGETAAREARARAGRHQRKLDEAVLRWRAGAAGAAALAAASHGAGPLFAGPEEALGATALPAYPLDPGALEGAHALLEGVQRRLLEIKGAEADADARRRAFDAARQAYDKARGALEARREGVLSAERARDEAAKALSDLAAEARGAAQALEGSAALLDGAFAGRPGWRERIAAKGAVAFAADCAQEAQEHARREAEEDRASRAAAALEPTIALAETASQEHAAHAALRAAEAKARAGALAALVAERRALLGGAPADAHERLLAERKSAAQKAFEAAQAAASTARAQAHSAGALLAEADRALEARAASLAAARASLDGALAEAHAATQDEASLRTLLARGAAWVAEREAGLSAIERALEGARAVLEERRRQRERHQEQGRPEGLAAAAAEAQGLARAAHDAADARLRKARIALESDDDARRRRALAGARLEEARERAKVWQTLSDLIGSEDGRKFRTFAQSLTLDALVERANLHLRDLAPRYALERIPRTDLELQVIDHALGEEVRGVTSLSGGEAFLVSLALALGLSSLAAGRARIECLFVDEGFGTLDPDTLDIAMAALDGLQADGRTIGLISHVPGLAERIGAQVQVTKVGGGRSTVKVVAAA